MKIYISGGITGRSIGEAVEQFDTMERKISQAGHVAVNPIRMMPYGLTWETYMEIASTILSSGEIDAIVMMRGWKSSRGAQYEWLWAQASRIPVIYENRQDEIDQRRMACQEKRDSRR